MDPEIERTPVMADAVHERSRQLSLNGLKPPLKLRGYEQERLLGRGAFGEVWVAINSNSGRKVAVKYYHRRGGLDWSLLSREVEKLRYLFGDRHVVQLLEVGWESDPPYYVMEYMENGSLEDLLRNGPVATEQALALFRSTAVGLVHAHGKGILHCDLKPANIMLDHDGQPRLADFGQSRLSHEHSPALGTLFYMAPEQADLRATPDVRWDVYALGALLYRLLTGVAPYRSPETLAAVQAPGTLEERLERYRELIATSPKLKAHRSVPGVDTSLAAIIDRCLTPNPRDRFPNVQAVLSALDARAAMLARRPLLVLGGLGPLLVMLVVLAIAGWGFGKTMKVAEEEVIERAMDGNRFAARSAANELGLSVKTRWQVLEAEAQNPELRRWLALGRALEDRRTGQQDQLNAWVRERHKYWDRVVPEIRSSLWFADDVQGYQRACSEPDLQAPGEYITKENGVLNEYFGFRDYFHGLGRNLQQRTPPADPSAWPKPLTRPHRSVVYRRKLSSTWAVAYSVPVWSLDPADRTPIGVLGMTSELVGPIRLTGEHDRFLVMFDARPDDTGQPGLLVRHPYQDEFKDNPTALPLIHDTQLIERPNYSGDYHDPVGRSFGEREWLVVTEPVRVPDVEPDLQDTGWIMAVQESKEQTVRPVRELRSTLAWAGGVAIVAVLVVLTLLWGFVMVVLNAAPGSRVVRYLRRQVGLKSGISGSSPSSSGSASHSGSTMGREATLPRVAG